MKEIKNVLDKNIANNIKEILLSNNFGWYLQNVIVNTKCRDKYFVHNFFDGTINSAFFDKIIIPILGQFTYKNIIRVKANLYPKTSKIIEHPFHIDNNGEHKVAIYYVNSNNGKTIFKNGKSIKSEENKLLLFSGQKEHKSTTCTDENFRINININYS